MSIQSFTETQPHLFSNYLQMISAKIAELSSCHRHVWPTNPRILSPIYRKRQLTSTVYKVSRLIKIRIFQRERSAPNSRQCNAKGGYCHYYHRIHDFLKYIGYLENNVFDNCGFMQLILIPTSPTP